MGDAVMAEDVQVVVESDEVTDHWKGKCKKNPEELAHYENVFPRVLIECKGLLGTLTFRNEA